MQGREQLVAAVPVVVSATLPISVMVLLNRSHDHGAADRHLSAGLD